MQNINQKCELCNMDATHSVTDEKNITHHFCEHHNMKDLVRSNVKNKSLLPLFFVLTGIFILSLIRQFTIGINFNLWMMDFMGIFFVIFGLFKLYDLKGFVESFKTYDIVAKRITSFGYAFPFIEITLGIMYLAGLMFLWQNIIALIITLLGIYSAYTVIKKREEVQCVCLGTFFNLKMTKVTLIENGVMFVMVIFMLLM